MGIYLFRTDHLGAYYDIYRVLVTPVVGHLYVRAGKAFAMELDYLQLRHFKNSYRYNQQLIYLKCRKTICS